MFRWILPWVWGAGVGGTGPVIVTEGPYWVSTYHAIRPRCYSYTVRPPQILPGRVWAEDPSLMVFAFSEGD